MSSGRQATTAAQASSTTFFSSVCPLVSTTASPKHPQSLTGSAQYIHIVSAVMMLITSSSRREVSLL